MSQETEQTFTDPEVTGRATWKGGRPRTELDQIMMDWHGAGGPKPAGEVAMMRLLDYQARLLESIEEAISDLRDGQPPESPATR